MSVTGLLRGATSSHRRADVYLQHCLAVLWEVFLRLCYIRRNQAGYFSFFRVCRLVKWLVLPKKHNMRYGSHWYDSSLVKLFLQVILHSAKQALWWLLPVNYPESLMPALQLSLHFKMAIRPLETKTLWEALNSLTFTHSDTLFCSGSSCRRSVSHLSSLSCFEMIGWRFVIIVCVCPVYWIRTPSIALRRAVQTQILSRCRAPEVNCNESWHYCWHYMVRSEPL